MKTLLTVLLLAPSFAFAHGAAVRCDSEGSLGPIVISITAEDSLFASERFAVTSQGMRTLKYEVRASLEPSLSADEVRFALKELEKGAEDQLTIKEGGVQADLVLAIQVVSTAPSVIVPTGEGLLSITQRPLNNRMILASQYRLTNCKGVL